MCRLRQAILCLAFPCLAVSALRAQAEPPPPELQAENARIQELWRGQRFEEALQVLRARAQSPGFGRLDAGTRSGIHYNLA